MWAAIARWALQLPGAWRVLSFIEFKRVIILIKIKFLKELGEVFALVSGMPVEGARNVGSKIGPSKIELLWVAVFYKKPFQR